ncbi:MAG: hypothetical protein ACP5IL_11050 [Syntrophobacteraceae bacterium]
MYHSSAETILSHETVVDGWKDRELESKREQMVEKSDLLPVWG